MEETWSFPIASCAEIKEVLRELEIPAPDSLLSRPDQASLEIVYKAIILLLADISEEVSWETSTPRREAAAGCCCGARAGRRQYGRYR